MAQVAAVSMVTDHQQQQQRRAASLKGPSVNGSTSSSHTGSSSHSLLQQLLSD